MSENTDKQEIGWGDEISSDGGGFVVLEPGDYPFQVASFKRSRSKGNEKSQPCNMAVVELDIINGDGRTAATVMHNMLLRRDLEWKICEFFRAIGARKHGEKIVPDWTKVVGASGTVKLGKREFTKKDGTKGESNEVVKFFDAEETVKTPLDEAF